MVGVWVLHAVHTDRRRQPCPGTNLTGVIGVSASRRISLQRGAYRDVVVRAAREVQEIRGTASLKS